MGDTRQIPGPGVSLIKQCRRAGGVVSRAQSIFSKGHPSATAVRVRFFEYFSDNATKAFTHPIAL